MMASTLFAQQNVIVPLTDLLSHELHGYAYTANIMTALLGCTVASCREWLLLCSTWEGGIDRCIYCERFLLK